MSDTRSEGHLPGAIRNRLHDGVIRSEEPDLRYGSHLTNSMKVQYICGVLGYPQDAFDLDLPLPIEDWTASDDMSLLSAGLYLADLREQFYSRVLTADDEGLEKDEAWSAHTLAEFWQFSFNRLLTRRRTSNLIMDKRVLH